MNEITIVVGRDFTPTPIGRYFSDGEYSGEAFRERVLIPALLRYDKVTVDLAGVIGYGSSFLEEAFGGVFDRKDRINPEVVRQKLFVTTSDPGKEEDRLDVVEYMNEQYAASKKD